MLIAVCVGCPLVLLPESAFTLNEDWTCAELPVSGNKRDSVFALR